MRAALLVTCISRSDRSDIFSSSVLGHALSALLFCGKLLVIVVKNPSGDNFAGAGREDFPTVLKG